MQTSSEPCEAITLLEAAVSLENEKLVKSLLDAGADPCDSRALEAAVDNLPILDVLLR